MENGTKRTWKTGGEKKKEGLGEGKSFSSDHETEPGGPQKPGRLRGNAEDGDRGGETARRRAGGGVGRWSAKNFHSRKKGGGERRLKGADHLGSYSPLLRDGSAASKSTRKFIRGHGRKEYGGSSRLAGLW